jgi:UDP-2,3-diacylglucosamine hydrolase
VKKTLIVSDVHLKVTDADRPVRDAFIAFLRSCSPDEYDRILCLGDLFDFWFEYRHAIFSDCFDVLRAFADLRDQGIELHLVCGNHDFWAGRFLRDELKFHLHPGSTRMDFAGRSALLVHGDGVNKKDYGYRIYKRIARNPLVVWAFRQLHPDWAMDLARFVSHGSRTLTRKENPAEGSEAKALRAYAQGILARGEADIVLCGHAHAVALEEHPTPSGTGLYINPGDWHNDRTYVVWDGETFRLESGLTAKG